MKNYLNIPVLCVILICAAFSKKTDAKPADRVKDKDQLAGKLLTLTGGNKAAEQMINQMAGNLPQAEMIRLLKRVDIDELMIPIASVYSKRFTAGELQDMIDQYETPAGKSFAKKRPAMTALAMKAGQVYSQKRLAGQPVDLPVPGPGKDDPLRNAQALLNASGEAAATEETLDTMLESLKRTNPAAARKLGEILDPVDINLLAAKAMADIFTVKEMQSMIKFFKTPTGVKWAKNMPAILRESGTAAENYFKDIFPR